jgi:hypothetical protein
MNLIEEKVKQKISQKLEDETKSSALLKRQITELAKKIEKLEIWFIKDEISKDLFKQYFTQYCLEKEKIEVQLNEIELAISNLEKAIKIACNSLKILLSADYDDKQKLQYLIFPKDVI